MKLKLIINCINISILLIIFACGDIFETDISKKEISILAPPDNFTTEDFTISFWWEYLDGADEYELAIVRGSFNYIEAKILDSTTTSNEYKITLYPGEFEWSIRALNSGYSTDYFIRSFTIDSTEKPQIVNIKAPNNPPNITNEDIITFSWFKASNAEKYYFELNEGNRLFYWTYTENTTLTFPDNANDRPTIPDGNYTFSIESINEANDHSNPTSSTIIVDRTAPRTPKPFSYQDTVQLSGGSFTLEWTTYQDTGL